jgi:hypothetical protein
MLAVRLSAAFAQPRKIVAYKGVFRYGKKFFDYLLLCI